jgi:localization factor PodJL
MKCKAQPRSITGIFRGCAGKQASIPYDSRMAEKPSARRAQGLSSSRTLRTDVGPKIPAVPGILRTGAAFDVAAVIAGRRPSWAVVGALAIIAALAVATIVLVLPGGGSRESGSATVISLPLPSEEALPANSAASAGIAAPGATTPPQNARAAAEWYLARASDGDPTAQYEIAVRYAEGRGVAKDYARAAAWFREAAINGVAAAQYDLGILYDTGLGLTRDPIEAVIWYQSAADRNQPIAQSKLGMVYLAGGAVPRNSEEAVRWLRRAAEQGVPDAQATLASLYELGDGVARSSKSAYGWYSLAANAGVAEARQAQSRLSQSFSSQELDEAEAWTARLAAQIAPLATAPPPRQGLEGLLLTSVPSEPGGVVSHGMISEIQRLLGATGYGVGQEDGLIGEQTAQAIRRYQQDVGMPVDGAPSLALLNRLRAAAAGPPPAAKP